MLSEPHTLYKLMILYMLRQVKFPLKNSHLSEFFLGREYTSFFTLQQALSELQEAHLISVESMRSTTQYEITREGEEALGYFGDSISEAIREDINTFLKENKIRLRNEVGVIADYEKSIDSDIMVRCEVRDGKATLISLNISVPSESHAERICHNWNRENQRIYAWIMQELLKDSKETR